MPQRPLPIQPSFSSLELGTLEANSRQGLVIGICKYLVIHWLLHIQIINSANGLGIALGGLFGYGIGHVSFIFLLFSYRS